MSAAVIVGDAIAVRAAPPSELLAMSALRQSFTADGLLGEWLNNHPLASTAAQIDATSETLALQSMSQPALDVHGKPALSLPDSTRLRILAQVGAKEAQRLLDMAPLAEVTEAEQMLKALLAQDAVAVNRNDYAQMSTLLAASQRAIALGIDPPVSPAVLAEQIRRIGLIKSLGGADLPRFIGRNAVLDVLAGEWQRHRNDKGVRTIAIEGPGGIGKSLTVTRFIVDLLDSTTDSPQVVYHLDFDQLELQTALPSAIWRKLIRQTRDWCDPDVADELEELAHRVSDSGDGTDAASESVRGAHLGTTDFIAHDLVRLISRDRCPRVLLFIDSYEQVEDYDDVSAAAPQQIARALADAGAIVLVLYASRSFARSPLMLDAHYRLRQFSVKEAVDYLTTEAVQAGLAISANRARRIQQVTGRTPLALRIALGLLEKGDLEERNWLVSLETAPELIQGLLYERLLRRLRDPQLRKIAAPGLLVRRLSEDIIVQVLAEPCQLDLNTTSAAQLMCSAQTEGQLFAQRPDDPHALWHRADVRSAMLASVQRSTPRDIALAIHAAAVDYYANAGDTPLFRTEELYHRLSLELDLAALDRRWTDEAGRVLRKSLAELPRVARSYLRERLGAATSKDRAGSPAAPTWTATVPPPGMGEYARAARRRLQTEAPDVSLIEQWRRSGGSLDTRLGAVVAAELVRHGMHDAVLGAAKALWRIAAPAHPKAVAEVMRIAAAVLEGRGALFDSLRRWEAAARFAAAAHDDDGELASLTGRLRVARKRGHDDDSMRTDRQRAIALLQGEFKELHNQKVLAREAVAELGPHLLADYPDLLRQLASTLIVANEAFPSAAWDPQRLASLSARFLGTPNNASMRNLSSAALRTLDGDSAREVIDAMREEVELALAQGAGPGPGKPD